MWVVFSLGVAFLSAFREAVSKRLLHREIHPFFLGGAQFMVAALVLLCGLAYTGLPQLGEGFSFAVIASVVLNIGASLLLFRALSLGELSLVAPLLTLSPVFTI